MQGKAEDAGGLTPAKDDNAAMRPLYPELLPGILRIAISSVGYEFSRRRGT